LDYYLNVNQCGLAVALTKLVLFIAIMLDLDMKSSIDHCQNLVCIMKNFRLKPNIVNIYGQMQTR